MDLPYYKTQQTYYIRKKQGKCVRCGSEKENPDMVHCNSCKEKVRLNKQKMYAKNKSGNLCVTCSLPTTTTSVYCEQCNQKNRERGRKTAKATKLKVISHYGGKCYCCQESIIDLLTIDHINGKGAKHRKELGNGKTNYCGEKFYSWLVKQGLPSGYQTACFSCNAGRHINGGVCPHQKNKSV